MVQRARGCVVGNGLSDLLSSDDALDPQPLFMVGALDEAFARVKPMLEAMGSTIHHCGPARAGTRTKIVHNFMAITSSQRNADALALSRRLGLDLDRTLDVVCGTTATNGQLKIAWPAKVLAGDTAPGFTIDLAHKDLTLVMETANAVKVPMPVAAAPREVFSRARARGFGQKIFQPCSMRSAMRSTWRRRAFRSHPSTRRADRSSATTLRRRETFWMKPNCLSDRSFIQPARYCERGSRNSLPAFGKSSFAPVWRRRRQASP